MNRKRTILARATVVFGYKNLFVKLIIRFVDSQVTAVFCGIEIGRKLFQNPVPAFFFVRYFLCAVRSLRRLFRSFGCKHSDRKDQSQKQNRCDNKFYRRFFHFNSSLVTSISELFACTDPESRCTAMHDTGFLCFLRMFVSVFLRSMCFSPSFLFTAEAASAEDHSTFRSPISVYTIIRE